MMRDILGDLGLIQEKIFTLIGLNLPKLTCPLLKNEEAFFKMSKRYLFSFSSLKSNPSPLVDQDSRTLEDLLKDFELNSEEDSQVLETNSKRDVMEITNVEADLIKLFLYYKDRFVDTNDFLETFLECGLSFSFPNLKYLYSAIHQTALVQGNSETLLFDFIKAYSEHILFYYPLIYPSLSSIELKTHAFSETDKDEFFSWLLVFSNINTPSSQLKSRFVRSQKIKLETLLEGGDVNDPVLQSYKVPLLHNLELYEKYGDLSVMKFGMMPLPHNPELYQKKRDFSILYSRMANSLLETIINNTDELKRIRRRELGARVIFNSFNPLFEYLVVDYSNTCEEKIQIDDFYITYILPISQFNEYLKNGDLFVNFFLWNGMALQFKDPFYHKEIIYSFDRIPQIIEFNEKAFYRFRELLGNTGIPLRVIQEEQIEPHFFFLQDIESKYQRFSKPQILRDVLSAYGQLLKG